MTAITIRPSSKRYKQSVIAGGGAGVVFFLIGSSISFGHGWLAFVLPAAVVLAALVIWMFLRNTRIEYGAGRFTTVNWLGVRRETPASSVGSVVEVQRLTMSPTYAVPNLLVLDAAGNKIVRVRGDFWQESDMHDLSAAITDRPDVIKAPITLVQLRERFPRALKWHDAHPVPFVISIVVGAFIVGFAALIGLAVLAGA